MEDKKIKITVFGSGSWGTALANVLCEKGYKIILWGRNEDKIKKILELRENIYYLPGYKLDPSLEITSDIEYATKDVDIAIFSLPVQGLRDFLKTNKEYLAKIKFFVNTGKGIEISTLKRPSEIIKEELNVDFERVATFSGPSFAKEVMEKKPLAIVIASMNLNTAKYLQDVLSLSFMRIYRSDDIIGVEIGGALKNVIAIAAGISDGLGFGYNAKASLITRGLVEINRIAILYGAHPFTILGLSGLGDLVLTSTSVLSRNWTIGKLIGEGLSLEEALDKLNGMVAEGVYTAKSAYYISQENKVYMPITQEVYKVLYENKSPKEALYSLLSKELKHEIDEDFQFNLL
ncbi:NAD(P)-dependent glycerol-3-phosphate dehydrogenase [Dictyoglomus thermophilum]|uniref:Glycerol-3-phosphate dehydrogenase [NAD(P)+] n=1 Tax=Dictyoglomus thermophilum TaxID=14 RepID=A0A7V3ZHD8_DICTH|nr:NAD(P)H-dependent glycerol-3-phosphate dehydrogenase [Dictyoglomus thermophilum]TYT22488.1 NAD(P)-dependent glycerol-3-phosphate dehydrogenase [Dictyoglomus thermophilum]